jgi:tRNA pseudouridine13 synthase
VAILYSLNYYNTPRTINFLEEHFMVKGLLTFNNFLSLLDTETVTVEGHRAVKVYRYHGNPAKKRQEKWPANRGDYCKFVLYKENKDTMEAIRLLAKLVHAKPGSFGYAGTKDRRGVTVQEIRVYRVQAQRLKGLNKTLKGMLLGNFEYCNDRLTLGQLSGNHFVITLRNVTGGTNNVEQAMDSLKSVGFINYSGLQRCGTTAVPTHHTGERLLINNWVIRSCSQYTNKTYMYIHVLYE